jgi:hypothetical protein
MAFLERDLQYEREQFLGLTTLEAARKIVKLNPKIQTVFLRPYRYVKGKIGGIGEERFPWERQDFTSGNLVSEFIENFGGGYNFALDSSVLLTNGRRGHFAMIDFNVSKSEEAKEKIIQKLNELIVPFYGGGLLLETGKSYHFLGFDIFDERCFSRFVGRALLTGSVIITPSNVPNDYEHLVDVRYLGHSLLRGTTGLRITAGERKTTTPRVIEVI